MKSRSFQILISITLLAGSLAINAACSNEVKQARIAELPSEDDGTPVPPATPPTTLEEDFKIYSTFASRYVTSYLHDGASADWSKNCSVSSTASTNATKYIDCILEAHELDLYASPLTLNFNAPASMCKYVRVRPYWYWRGTAGTGPTYVEITKNGSAPPTITGRTFAPGSTINVNLVNGQLVCTADHRARPNGPNCCEGKYTVKTITITPSTTTSPTPTPTPTTTETFGEGDWGGKVGNCAQGAAEQFPAGREKFHAIPRLQLYSADEGVTSDKTAFKIESPLELDYGSTVIHNSNYYAPAPAAVPPSLSAPVIDSDGTTWTPTRYYTYECLDSADEIKARIRLQIRRWTMMEELEKKNLGTWNRSGVESGTGDPLLDFLGWEDSPLSSSLIGW